MYHLQSSSKRCVEHCFPQKKTFYPKLQKPATCLAKSQSASCAARPCWAPEVSSGFVSTTTWMVTNGTIISQSHGDSGSTVQPMVRHEIIIFTSETIMYHGNMIRI